MRKYFLIILALGIICLYITPTWALVINPSDDTYIAWRSNNSTTAETNFNGNTSSSLFYLKANHIALDDGFGYEYEYRSLLKFELSGIPQGATVTSATLTLYPAMTTDRSPFVEVHRVGFDNWQEGTITWNNSNTAFTTNFVPALLDTQQFPDMYHNQPVTWNLLPLWGWSQDLADNYVTFLLKRQGSGIGEVNFVHKEYPNSPNIPFLTLEYTTNSVPLPPGFLLLGSGLLGLAGWRRFRKN
jgi:hypothetical protein